MNVKNYTFSTIVPYYNTKIDQIETCIKSLLVQDLNLLKEIIIVNDGSDEEYTNSLVNLVNKLNKEKAIIKLIHQKNQGQASARKTGFENSNGDIILFVDSDDWICDELMINKCNEYFKTSTEINVINFKFIETKTEKIKLNNKNKSFNITRLNFEWYFNKKIKQSPITIWAYVYKRCILENDKRFWNNIKIPFEDVYFNSILISKNLQMLETNEIFYAYRKFNNSSTTKNCSKLSIENKLKILYAWFTSFSDWNIYTYQKCYKYWIAIIIKTTTMSSIGFRRLILLSKKINVSCPNIKEIKRFIKQYKLYPKIRRFYMLCCAYVVFLDYLLPKMHNFINTNLFFKKIIYRN